MPCMYACHVHRYYVHLVSMFCVVASQTGIIKANLKAVMAGQEPHKIVSLFTVKFVTSQVLHFEIGQ